MKIITKDVEKFNNIETLRNSIVEVVKKYPVTNVKLFGSRANGNNAVDSDVDLLCEFNTPYVSLLVLSGLKMDLEDKLGLSVDLVHAPIEKDAIIEIDKEIPIYEA